MTAHAIIVAGGKGSRAGGKRPKQRQMLGSKPVYQWSINVFRSCDKIDQIVLVVPGADIELYLSETAGENFKIVKGGIERTDSVLNGLCALDAKADDKVLIHDAARPGIHSDLISRLLLALEESDATAPALLVADALKRQTQQGLQSVERSNLHRVQTPQAFRFKTIKAALEVANGALVDDLAAIENQGGTIKLIEGHEDLAKITYPGDLERMERLIAPQYAMPRIGSGFDVHAFGAGNSVTLCGVEIEHTHGLAGHSDADVAWHALTDAILGALALGDIGDHFPPSDPQWKGAPSKVFLSHAMSLAVERGYGLVNCDLTLICEAPKIKPHREAMCQKTADLLNVPLDAVSVKATTTEQLGFTGRGEGIAAQATCILVPSNTFNLGRENVS